MVDKSGMVKVIDFGIGKIFNPESKEDSLVSEINRANSDTLPQEYYSGEYTSLTDMFYLAELLNRLIATGTHSDEMHFSYQDILDKMMKKQPEERFQSFAEIRYAIGKHNFLTMEISDADKKIYQQFSNNLCGLINKYTSEPKFISDANELILRLKKVLQNNLFEDVIQDNTDLISSIVLCGYNYNIRPSVPCEIVKKFLDWLEAGTSQSKELILNNIVSKLSKILYEEPEPELPF